MSLQIKFARHNVLVTSHDRPAESESIGAPILGTDQPLSRRRFQHPELLNVDSLYIPIYMRGLFRVAIVQSSPAFLNLDASLAKAITLAEEAGKREARLIAFGETWLPGYPAWLDYCSDVALWDHRPSKDVFAKLRQNSLTVPGKETETLAQIAGDLKVTVVIGANERVETGPGNGTLYNTLLTFTPDGKLANHHRKLVPTYTERLVWGQGDGRGLVSTATPWGRVGGLICWEHWMPMARQALHLAGEHVHVAVWPTVNEMHQLASRHYAFEGRCFVLAVGLMMRTQDIPSA